MATQSAKASEIERKWYVVDAAGQPLGHRVGTIAQFVDCVEYTVAGVLGDVEVAAEGVPHVRLVQSAAAPHQVPGHDQHARRAVAALQRGVLDEGLLQRMQLAVLLETLDGGDVCAVVLDRQRQAGQSIQGVFDCIST